LVNATAAAKATEESWTRRYVLTTNTLDKVSGVEVLTAACAACKETVEKQKGRLLVKEAARAVTERDDRLLTEQLTALEAANRCASLVQGFLLPVYTRPVYTRLLFAQKGDCLCTGQPTTLEIANRA
jgi:hypothetical protein